PMRFAFFDTAVGRSAIAWTDDGVIALALPEKTEARTRDRLKLVAPDLVLAEPSAAIASVIAEVVAHLAGDVRDLSSIAIDWRHTTPAARRVYEAARAVELGGTASDADVAARMGGTVRSVTQALAKNRYDVLVPSHRILTSDGRIGPVGNVVAKLRMLAMEAAHLEGDATLDFDPVAAVAHLRASDADLARMMDRIGPYTVQLKRTPSIFVALAESIVYQQLAGRAAATIWARVRALFPHGHVGPTPDQLLRASDTALRGAGLSRNKLLAIRDLARRAAEGSIPTLVEAQTMDNEALVEALTEVRGIGRWTVEMLLIFRLGRPDLLPVDDLGIQKGFARTYRKRKLPTKRQMLARGERWRPYRSVASWYFWRIADLKG
ncbi:MAG: methylated-DNA--[protein]-cysteine S-methyltransferase, partial [Polyangia bacterium]